MQSSNCMFQISVCSLRSHSGAGEREQMRGETDWGMQGSKSGKLSMTGNEMHLIYFELVMKLEFQQVKRKENKLDFQRYWLVQNHRHDTCGLICSCKGVLDGYVRWLLVRWLKVSDILVSTYGLSPSFNVSVWTFFFFLSSCCLSKNVTA